MSDKDVNPILKSNRAAMVLAKNGLAIGVAVRLVHKVDIGKIMRTCGFDFLFLDMEHTPVSTETITQICVAAQDAGIAPIVRVPNVQDRSTLVQVLDGGAQGIVFPHIDTVEEAQLAVAMCRYPPIGSRSVAYGLPHADFKQVPRDLLCESMNRNTLIAVMLETPKSIEAAGSIAAVNGIDILHVGMQDLSMELGISNDLLHPKLVAAVEKVHKACLDHGKVLGLGGCYDFEALQRYVGMGIRFTVVAADLPLLMAGAAAQASRVRNLLKKEDRVAV